MNFGITVLVILAVWAVISILVSVTIGYLADYRDADRFRAADADERRETPDRIAS